jgi:hypothetical protein
MNIRLYPLFFVILLSGFSCKKSNNIQHISMHNDSLYQKSDIKKETEELFLLNDTFRRTGDYKYLDKYVLKLDSLIKKYPNNIGFKQVKEQTIEMFGDSMSVK